MVDESRSATVSKWVPTTDLFLLRRMGKLLEELGELSAVAARVIIQGLDEIDPASHLSNRSRLEQEIADVLAQCVVCIKTLPLQRDVIGTRQSVKEQRMVEWESLFHQLGASE